ncbi:Tyrosine recombinase XerD [uncultured Roseburia sp.]|uniref:Tyrosine-type recombinase/integrase n=1 Tax=Brotonthovivens ammoniilytica TaxID=2981725 RepID=A0ABT2TG26_9FIRM|nr:tyrosine-type recombinase/integrase [Brotonthovivens ammoniilytica]MCU6761097.1 tyrosine-type recombinase/integrase [Brotonthovivens ammoniilytica]SCI18741.1 Tyrosine recombinase XerD [uncultured Roseburia sp.]
MNYPNTEKEVILQKEYLAGFEEYLVEKECASNTIKKYISDVKKFYGFLSGNLEISKERLIEYKKWLISKYSGSSVNSMLVACNQFLDFLGLGRMKVRLLKIQRQLFLEEEKNLSRSEYLKLVNTARRKGKEQLALIMETICSTGIRVSELEYFTVSGVHRGKVNIWNKGKYRVIILPKKMQYRLLAYIKEQKIASGPIFRTRNGKAKHRSNIWREMKQLACDAGIDPVKIFPHNLRHLFARTFYQVTKNLVNLADILGHSNMEVTRIYTSDGLNIWKKNINRLDLLGKKITT